MPSIEERIEAMWENPQTRRDRWLGFYGKLGYELLTVAVVFTPLVGVLYVGSVVWPYSLPTTIVGQSFIGALILWVANRAFCNIIGR